MSTKEKIMKPEEKTTSDRIGQYMVTSIARILWATNNADKIAGIKPEDLAEVKGPNNLLQPVAEQLTSKEGISKMLDTLEVIHKKFHKETYTGGEKAKSRKESQAQEAEDEMELEAENEKRAEEAYNEDYDKNSPLYGKSISRSTIRLLKIKLEKDPKGVIEIPPMCKLAALAADSIKSTVQMMEVNNWTATIFKFSDLEAADMDTQKLSQWIKKLTGKDVDIKVNLGSQKMILVNQAYLKEVCRVIYMIPPLVYGFCKK